jgi:glycosyltransferase involved in cell wall biosynthesis
MAKPSLHIGIIGTRGIPNRYGGFEAFAEQLAPRLVDRGHQITVFCSHDQEFREPIFKGVTLDFRYNPEKRIGTPGQFIYDLNCNLKVRRDALQVVLHLGYTSDSVWHWLWRPGAVHITNMDGFEWQRSKYSKPVRKFLKRAESWAARHSHALVADSQVVLEYLQNTYNTPACYIAYGAEIPEGFDLSRLHSFGLEAGRYDLVIARMEPENNIEMAIQAHLRAGTTKPLVIIGNETGYGDLLKSRYRNEVSVRFQPPCYDKETLHSIRHYCRYYIHGHSSGGTNPSLLEAMACGCHIIAHENPFNKEVLGGNALFYRDADTLAGIFSESADYEVIAKRSSKNLEIIRNRYSWDHITDAYEVLFCRTAGLSKD